MIAGGVKGLGNEMNDEVFLLNLETLHTTPVDRSRNFRKSMYVREDPMCGLVTQLNGDKQVVIAGNSLTLTGIAFFLF